MTYTVKLTNMGVAYWLRGTTWTSAFDRASVFATEAAAQAALDTAKQFMKPATRKLARIEAA